MKQETTMTNSIILGWGRPSLNITPKSETTKHKFNSGSELIYHFSNDTFYLGNGSYTFSLWTIFQNFKSLNICLFKEIHGKKKQVIIKNTLKIIQKSGNAGK